MCSPCGEEFGSNIPEGATLAVLLATADKRSDGSGGTLSLPSRSQHRASPRPKLRHPSMSWLRKNLSTTKPPRTRGSLRRDSRNRRRPLRSCGSNSQLNRISLGGLFLHYHKPRKRRNSLWLVCVLCALLCMVLPMATKMHRDLRQWSSIPTCSNRRSGCSMNLQRGQEQNRMWTTQPSSNALTDCWVKPKLYSSRTQTRRTSSISTRVFDDESCLESESNLVAKEIGVVVAGSPAANGIAGFLFRQMHVKEKGLVKLRSKFALQGFHDSV